MTTILEHKCTLNETKTNIPANEKHAKKFHRCLKNIRGWFLVSRNNPLCSSYFRSQAAVNYERKRHMQSSNWYIIHPLSSFCSYWEHFMAFVYIISMLVSPYDVGYNYLSYNENRNPLCTCAIINTICCFLFDLNIVITCFTGLAIYSKTRISLQQSEILTQYLKTYLTFDILAAIPVDLVEHYTFHNVFKSTAIKTIRLDLSLLYLIRIVRINTMLEYIDRIKKVNGSTYRIIRLLGICAIVIHWTACLTFIFPKTLNIWCNMERKNWVSEILNDLYYPHKEDGNFIREKLYLYTLQRAMTNLLNVGQSSYITTAYEDLIIRSLTVIFGLLYSSYVFVSGIQILLSRDASYVKYLEIMNQLQEYMRHKQLPISMQNRLISYYEYRFRHKYFRENAITDTLSNRLRQEISVHCCHRLVESVEIFKDLPKQVIGIIIDSLRPEVFLPGDILMKAGNSGECMYFLVNGTIAVYTSNGKEICHLEDGTYFGEIALLMPEQKRVATAVAIEICNVFRLDRRNFCRCFDVNSGLYDNIVKNALIRMKETLDAEEQQRMHIIENANIKWKSNNTDFKTCFSCKH